MELKRAKVIAINHNDEQLSDYEKSILQYDGANIYHTNLNPCLLHFTTDEEPKKGEWVIVNGGLNRIGIDKYQTNVTYSIKPRKIIATTDESLTFNCDCCKGTGLIEEEPCRTCISGKTGRLPQPSQAFIQKYVELGGIDEVDIELTHQSFHIDSEMDEDDYGLIIKVDSHNTITIHPIKTSWTKDEVINISEKAYHYGRLNSQLNMPKFEEWIKQNLN